MGKFVVELDKFKTFVKLLDSLTWRYVRVDATRVEYSEKLMAFFADPENVTMSDISCPITILDGKDMPICIDPDELNRALQHIVPSSVGHSVTCVVEDEYLYIGTGMMTIKYDMPDSPGNIAVPKRLNLSGHHQVEVLVEAAPLYAMLKLHDSIEDTHLWTHYNKAKGTCVVACGNGTIAGIPVSSEFGCGRSGVQNTILGNGAVREVNQLRNAEFKGKCLSMYGHEVALRAVENLNVKQQRVKLTVGHNCPM